MLSCRQGGGLRVPNQTVITLRQPFTRLHIPKSTHGKGLLGDSRRRLVVQPAALPVSVRSASAAMILLWSQLLSADAFPSLEASRVVPIRREVVEEMLMHRFSARVKTMSDSELSALMEQLLEDNAVFPASILEPPSSPPSQPFSLPPSPPVVKDKSTEGEGEVSALVKAFQSQVSGAAEDPSPDAAVGVAEPVRRATVAGLSPEDAIRFVAVGVGGSAALVALISLIKRGPDGEDGAQEQWAGAAVSEGRAAALEAPEKTEQTREAAGKDKESWWSGLLSFLEKVASDGDTEQPSGSAAPSTDAAPSTSGQSQRSTAPRPSFPNGGRPPQRPPPGAVRNGVAPNSVAGMAGRARPPPPPPRFPGMPSTASSSSGDGVVWKRKERGDPRGYAAPPGTRGLDRTESTGRGYASTAGTRAHMAGGYRHPALVLDTNTEVRNVDLWRVPLEDLKALGSEISDRGVGVEASSANGADKVDTAAPPPAVASVERTGAAEREQQPEVDTEDAASASRNDADAHEQGRPFPARIDFEAAMDNAEEPLFGGRL